MEDTPEDYDLLRDYSADFLGFSCYGSSTITTHKDILEKFKDRIYTIPMTKKLNRSLNLANSVAIVLYEGLRQNKFLINRGD